MKWFKKLFGLKEKEKEEEVILNDFSQLIIEEPKEEWKECFFCKNMIYRGDKFAKQQGKYFHRNCYKEMLKQVKGFS
jgi:hypothetical protein